VPPGAEFETLTGLLQRYSPSGSEQLAAGWLAERMLALGFEQAGLDEAGNVVGHLGGGPRQLVLLGHIDTVPGEIPLRQADGRLYGRGAVDAKGPLACFVDAVAQVGALAGWQFTVIGAVEEERQSEGALYVAPRYRPDFAIIGEPNRWDRVALGYKGSAWARATLRRSQAHSAGQQQSACEAAVETWLTVRGWAESFNAGRSRAFDQLLLTLRGLESGGDGFEEWASLRIGARLPLDLPPEAWYAQLAQLAPEIERLGFAIPAYQCEKNTPLVRAFLSAIRAQGGSPGFVFKTGTADLNIVGPAWGCPMLVYGPGDSALDHTPDEHILLDEYARALSVLAGALRGLAGAG
jgi:[amino group carrier protein]-lysine/ornithine hydrolase